MEIKIQDLQERTLGYSEDRDRLKIYKAIFHMRKKFKVSALET